MATAESKPRTLVIACGARWDHISVTCLPAKLHNRPQAIPEAVRQKIRAERGRFDRIVIGYADCGTGGLLDEVIAQEGVERIAGPHCYAFYSGTPRFEAEADRDPFCFYLTDYLVRHFERLVIEGLGLDRHPELHNDYFGHYQRVVYLAQTENKDLETQAQAAAERLGLDYEYRFTGYGELAGFLEKVA
jgi:hypothetical protein